MKTYIKPVIFSSLAGLAISLSACSQASSADTVPAASAEMAAGNWDIQPERSHIQFTAEQEGKPFTGEFGEFSGVIDFDPAAPEAGSVKITIPLKSVDAGSGDRNSFLPETIWFSTKAHPMAVFTSSDISAKGDGFIAKGELTLKGVSVPLDLPFDLELNGDIATMTSNIKMNRLKWNVGAEYSTDQYVSKAVKLDIKVTAEKIK